MNPAKAKLRFWGVRGSTPTVDPDVARYGGNTACLELTTPEGDCFILDCGSGIRSLGKQWLQEDGEKPTAAHAFVTHYHWDHIQGMPFFTPLYLPKYRFHFYSFPSPHLGRGSLKQVLEAQMANPYFPVDMGVMSAAREFSEVSGGDQLQISRTRITARWLNHPQGCLGFRFETSAGIIVYATDNEPGEPALDRNLRELAAGADIFVNDAQYTPEQLATNRKGWGHSTWLEGVNICQEVGAKNLVLFHHDPDSPDRVVDQLLCAAREKFSAVWAAAEGMTMEVSEKGVHVVVPHWRVTPRGEALIPTTVRGQFAPGRSFEEETVTRDVSMQGASLFLQNSPPLQSQVVVTMQTSDKKKHGKRTVSFRGFVVRNVPVPGQNMSEVGIIFTEERKKPRK